MITKQAEAFLRSDDAVLNPRELRDDGRRLAGARKSRER